uniref:Uncharacterized protein n=1 Tax=Oryza sativa subsp. japonica TaxID=39947 RepID=Q8GVN1_ORYSJ|nr:hypothetical protein [Oryza sativa Japonica Group]BAD31679.1 hypothetical protein [Oryza sativa Japonica Group]
MCSWFAACVRDKNLAHLREIAIALLSFYLKALNDTVGNGNITIFEPRNEDMERDLDLEFRRHHPAPPLLPSTRGDTLVGIHQPIENDTSGGGGEAPTAKVPHSDLGYEVAISLDTPLTFLPDESSSEEETVATWRLLTVVIDQFQPSILPK